VQQFKIGHLGTTMWTSSGGSRLKRRVERTMRRNSGLNGDKRRRTKKRAGSRAQWMDRLAYNPKQERENAEPNSNEDAVDLVLQSGEDSRKDSRKHIEAKQPEEMTLTLEDALGASPANSEDQIRASRISSEAGPPRLEKAGQWLFRHSKTKQSETEKVQQEQDRQRFLPQIETLKARNPSPFRSKDRLLHEEDLDELFEAGQEESAMEITHSPQREEFFFVSSSEPQQHGVLFFNDSFQTIAEVPLPEIPEPNELFPTLTTPNERLRELIQLLRSSEPKMFSDFLQISEMIDFICANRHNPLTVQVIFALAESRCISWDQASCEYAMTNITRAFPDQTRLLERIKFLG